MVNGQWARTQLELVRGELQAQAPLTSHRAFRLDLGTASVDRHLLDTFPGGACDPNGLIRNRLDDLRPVTVWCIFGISYCILYYSTELRSICLFAIADRSDSTDSRQLHVQR
jgi:hypothetical protein